MSSLSENPVFSSDAPTVIEAEAIADHSVETIFD